MAKSSSISIRFDARLLEALKRVAEREDVPLAEVVRRIAEQWAEDAGLVKRWWRDGTGQDPAKK